MTEGKDNPPASALPIIDCQKLDGEGPFQAEITSLLAHEHARAAIVLVLGDNDEATARIQTKGPVSAGAILNAITNLAEGLTARLEYEAGNRPAASN